MIISKTPFRISLFGGSTDYESYYSQFGSFLVGFSINQYCYISLRQTPTIFGNKSKLSYSKIEEVECNSDIQHNGIRGTLEYLGVIDQKFEISHQSDLPSQTGIGSSSSFIVGLLNCLSKHYGIKTTPKHLANSAISIERKLLREPGGIQDQIWAAYGGVKSIEIDTNGEFYVKPIPISDCFIDEWIDKWSILIYTGQSRNSYDIATSHNTTSSIEYKKEIHSLAKSGYDSIVKGNLEDVGSLLHESWNLKKNISNKISNGPIDALYDELLSMGMIGGKLLGSGGSGFIYGIVYPDSKLDIIEKFKTKYVPFGISKEGSVIING